MLVADLDYSDYLGRLAVGRIMHGKVFAKESLACIGEGGEARPLRATRLQVYDGLQLSEVEEARPGDIVVLAGSLPNLFFGHIILIFEELMARFFSPAPDAQ